jgi:hypothetical protein
VPLYIANYDPTDGTVFETNTVFLHLAKLVVGDGELGIHVDPLDLSVSLIDYKTPATSGFCQTIIRELANGSFPNKNIIIHGVTSNYLVQIKDIQRWHQISEFGGIVMFNPSVSLKPLENSPYETFDLHVIYDVQECNGKGYVCKDNSNQIIGLPIEIVLIHELSHAYHYCKRDFNFSNPELQAEIDENKARTQLGYQQRNQDNHDGRCRDANETGKTFWDDCFIVSAAYGSCRAAEVRTLQAFRDQVLRTNPICWLFFELFFEDYYRFSPRIAAAMTANHPMAQLVRDAIVGPLLNFWNWTCAWILYGCSEADLGIAVSQAFQYANDSSSNLWNCQLHHKLPGLLAGLRKDWTKANRPTRSRRERPLLTTDNPESIFRELADFIVAQVDRPEIMAWAILHPIEIYWRLRSLRNLQRAIDDFGRDVARMINEWLSELPLSIDCLPCDSATLRVQLRDLRTNIIKVPEARSVLGQLLLDKFWRQIPDLERILLDEGFSTPGRDVQKIGARRGRHT